MTINLNSTRWGWGDSLLMPRGSLHSGSRCSSISAPIVMAALPIPLHPSLLGGSYWNYIVHGNRVPLLLWTLSSDPIFSNAFCSLFPTFPTRSPQSSHLFHSNMFWEDKKTLIAYIGIVVTTAFISTSFPTWFNFFDLHPWSLSWIHALRYPNAAFFYRPHIEGSLRYFPGSFDIGM